MFADPFGEYHPFHAVIAALPPEVKDEDGPYRNNGIVDCPMLIREERAVVAQEEIKEEAEEKLANRLSVAERVGRMLAWSVKYAFSGGSAVQWGDVKDRAAPTPPPVLPPPTVATIPWVPRKIVIVGVHGWSVLGGAFADSEKMSIRFCHLFSWALCKKLLSSEKKNDVRICQLPLSGHGKVEARVAAYMELLGTKREELASADLIVFASHSQGVIVSNFMIYQLLTEGWLDAKRQQVMLLGICGVHHGPYPDTISDYYNATKELFSFSRIHLSLASRHLVLSRFNLRHGVRMLQVASWMDEVVPLFSASLHALGANANLRRALYVDKKHRAMPGFLRLLMKLLFLLQNEAELGEFSDLLVHLSGFFRGSLFSSRDRRMHSEAHSEMQVYDMACQWALAGRGLNFTTSQQPPLSSPPSSSSSASSSSTDTVVAEEDGSYRHGPVAIRTQSFSLLAHMLTDYFCFTDVNKHLVSVRFQELVDVLRVRERRGHGLLVELESLVIEFENWVPDSKASKILKELLAPSLAPRAKL